MAEKKIWSERVLSSWGSKLHLSSASWFTLALSFLLAIWLTGLLLYAADGQQNQYMDQLRMQIVIYAQCVIIMYGARGFNAFLDQVRSWARPILNMGDQEFDRFYINVVRWAYSPLPPLIWSFTYLLINVFLAGPGILFITSAHQAWDFLLLLIYGVITGTGIWIIVSLWLLVFRISRQPLNLQLSPQTSRTFRPFAIASLYGAGGVFLSLAIIPFVYSPSSPAQVVLFGSFIAFSALAFLIPVYNIHTLLVRMKKDAIQQISDELDQLLAKLDESSGERPSESSRDRAAIIATKLSALPLKEKLVSEAEEWPVSNSFFTALVTLALTPIARLLFDILTKVIVPGLG